MTAVVPLPGMPRARVGTMAPPVAELFAASGPAIPSIQPDPNSSGVFDQRLASLYPIIAAMVPPSAGKMPMKVPIPVLRKMTFQTLR